jgi:hypothetical protein
MTARDSLETDTRVVDAPDAPRETVGSPRGQVLDDPERRREESAESQQQVDGNRQSRPFKVDRPELAQFDLKRAGLPDMSIESAAKYIEEHRAARPWLAMADRASPEARRIIAALDAAGGHAHIRHEGWVTEEANRRRVLYREDPAQLNPEKRALGIDGLRQDDKRHRCGAMTTRIADPDAFAAAFARAVDHPKVREALDRPFDTARKPDEVIIPIAELLGPEGHEHCTGWKLEPVDGSTQAARAQRNDWLADRAKGREPKFPEPRAAPVKTFEGGEIILAVTRIEGEQRYGVITMYARPGQRKRQAATPPLTKEQLNGTVLLGT